LWKGLLNDTARQFSRKIRVRGFERNKKGRDFRPFLELILGNYALGKPNLSAKHQNPKIIFSHRYMGYIGFNLKESSPESHASVAKKGFGWIFKDY
jgi:hypothetical protein